MPRTVLWIAAILAIAILLYAAARPSTLVVTRSTVIHAPAEKIFPLIDDFHQWGAWSPWERLDPAMQKTFSGPESGEGAGYEWNGDDKVGQGSMVITACSEAQYATIKLDFIKPMEGRYVMEFLLEPQGGATVVRWTMQGHNNYFAKLMGVFVNMDRVIGKDFDAGLASLKAAAEK